MSPSARVRVQMTQGRSLRQGANYLRRYPVQSRLVGGYWPSGGTKIQALFLKLPLFWHAEVTAGEDNRSKLNVSIARMRPMSITKANLTHFGATRLSQ